MTEQMINCVRMNNFMNKLMRLFTSYDDENNKWKTSMPICEKKIMSRKTSSEKLSFLCTKKTWSTLLSIESGWKRVT